MPRILCCDKSESIRHILAQKKKNLERDESGPKRLMILSVIRLILPDVATQQSTQTDVLLCMYGCNDNAILESYNREG